MRVNHVTKAWHPEDTEPEMSSNYVMKATAKSGVRRKMTEKRRFSRIKYVVGGKLLCRETTFICRLENLSMGGALVTIRNATINGICIGDTCLLQLYHEIEGRHISVESLVAHHGFAFVGLAFLNLDAEAKASLEKIMEREKHKTFGMGDNATYYSSYGNGERYSP